MAFEGKPWENTMMRRWAGGILCIDLSKSLKTTNSRDLLLCK
jgi:hypothetical protein